MERKNYREIVTALNDLPEGRRPASISVATVTRDVKVLRDEWAAERVRDMDELVGEPVALTGDKQATEMVLAIQRQRLYVMGIGGRKGAVQVTAGAMAAAPGGVNT